MKKLRIKGRLEIVENIQDFLWIIEEHLGEDARRFAQEYLKPVDCGGECDATYKLQEHYERVIRDAVEELELIKGRTAKMDEQLRRTIRELKIEV